MAAWVPAAISAASSLIGGLFGQKKADEQAKLQREFAQNSVQWKVEDAKKAGVSPLFALGAPTVSYSPISVGSDLASGITNAGQDISRAVTAGMTGRERLSTYDTAVQQLSLKRMDLENTLLASQIARINSAGGIPPLPGNTAALALPTGDMVPVGAGASAQSLEDEYGEVGPELESFYRYVRDRVPAMIEQFAQQFDPADAYIKRLFTGNVKSGTVTYNKAGRSTWK